MSESAYTVADMVDDPLPDVRFIADEDLLAQEFLFVGAARYGDVTVTCAERVSRLTMDGDALNAAFDSVRWQVLLRLAGAGQA